MVRPYKKIVKLSPAISSKNLGDYIIDDYCSQIIDEIFPASFSVSIPTHEHFSTLGCEHIATADASIVCGTNLLTSHMKQYRQWNVNLQDAIKLWLIDVPKKKMLSTTFIKEHFEKNKVLLLGAGWWQYQDKPDSYSTRILRMMLSSRGIHSVRDSYTEQMLKSIGINNVLNTACPTMWKLTEEHCNVIPTVRSDTVVTTLTDYNVNDANDDLLLDILLRNYESVFVWLQAIEDYDQIQRSKYFKRIKVIPPTLRDYDLFLGEIPADYVGTRLHGGIRALNKKCRTIIIAVDNRALEISNDTGLQVIKREDVAHSLEKKICGNFATCIKLPEKNIHIWKEQFQCRRV